MKLQVVLLWFSLALAAPAFAQSAAPPVAAPDNRQEMFAALTRANAAVVGVQVTATDGARSAESLGRRRAGSGVVIGDDGLVLTIGYLMLEADAIQIVTQDNKTVPARAVAYDLATGFGLLRPLLPISGIAPVPLGSGTSVANGAPLLAAIGGQGGGVAITQLVGQRAFSGYWEYHIDGALFTSPPVGNHSGAPLFNERGELLGIGSLFVGNALGDERRVPGNMFVPVDLLKPILAEMQQTGSTRQSRRPWLGLTSSEQAGRVQVVRVAKDSPAESAGLRPGDVVLAIDNTQVATLEAFYKALWAHPNPDDEITLMVLQDQQIKSIVVKAVDRMTTVTKPPGI